MVISVITRGRLGVQDCETDQSRNPNSLSKSVASGLQIQKNLLTQNDDTGTIPRPVNMTTVRDQSKNHLKLVHINNTTLIVIPNMKSRKPGEGF